jgi:hypothetical protein
VTQERLQLCQLCEGSTGRGQRVAYAAELTTPDIETLNHWDDPVTDDVFANKEIARKFLANFERGDVDAVIPLFWPDASYWIPTVRREYEMREFKEALLWIQSRLKDGIRFEIGPIVAEGSRVCIIAESFATITIPPTYSVR